MSSLVNAKASKKASKSKVFRTPKEKFQHYWERIEKAEKTYRAAERQRTRLIETFNETLLPLEQELCQKREAYIYQLLSFSSKKTLPLYLKHELLDWIQEEYIQLVSSPFTGSVDVAALREDIDQSIHAVVGESEKCQVDKESERESLRMEIESVGISTEQFDDDDIDHLLEAMMRGPHVFLAELMSMRADAEASSGDPESQETRDSNDANDSAESFEENFGFSPEDDLFNEPKATKQQDVLSKQSINKFYKKIAQRIHPDRAEDEKDRDRRNTLMQVLTQAKKENDAFTIFNLYQEYVDSHDFNFSDEEFDVLIGLLQDKLYVLQEQKRELKLDGGIDAIVYERFHARSKRETQERMKEHQMYLKDWMKAVEGDTRAIKTLKKLKEQLQLRIAKAQDPDVFWL